MSTGGMVERLIRQMEQRGLSIRPGREPGQLLLAGPDREKTPEVLAAVKAFKPQLLERYGQRSEPDLPGEKPDAIAEPEQDDQTPPAAEPSQDPPAGEPSPPTDDAQAMRRGLCRPRQVCEYLGSDLADCAYRMQRFDPDRDYRWAERLMGLGWGLATLFQVWTETAVCTMHPSQWSQMFHEVGDSSWTNSPDSMPSSARPSCEPDTPSSISLPG